MSDQELALCLVCNTPVPLTAKHPRYTHDECAMAVERGAELRVLAEDKPETLN